jgi:methionine-rich copper-binding protein CopC
MRIKVTGFFEAMDGLPQAVQGMSFPQWLRRAGIFVVNKINRTRLIYLLLLAPSLASAHAYLMKSVPAGRATLFNSPGKIQLWFNERLEPKYSYASVHDPDGKRVDSDNAQVSTEDPKQLSIGVKKLPAGRYTVKFRVLSVDGHVVEQSFPFTIRDAKN